MNTTLEQRIIHTLNQLLNPDGNIQFLAITAISPEGEEALPPLIQVRVALTLSNSSGMNHYFDGTDVFLIVTPENICFTREEEWADGPPILEGSPIELALDWVSELAPPFFVSPEAQEAANRRASSSSEQPLPIPPTDFNPWF